MEQINLNNNGQDNWSAVPLSAIPANYDDLQDWLQAALMNIAALEGNRAAEYQARQQAEEIAVQHLQQNIQA